MFTKNHFQTTSVSFLKFSMVDTLINNTFITANGYYRKPINTCKKKPLQFYTAAREFFRQYDQDQRVYSPVLPGGVYAAF